MSTHPNVTTGTAVPMSTHPNGVPMRRAGPTATDPNPAAMPCPVARRPDESGTRGGDLDFHLRRGRPFCDDLNVGGRRGLWYGSHRRGWGSRLTEINGALNAAGENQREYRKCQQ